MFRDLVLAALSLLWAIVLVLCGGRFLALLIGANQDSELVQRLYSWSEFWVKPFFDVLGFSNEAVSDTGGTFEPASLIAFAVYFLVGALILGVLRTASSFYYGHGGHRYA